MQAANSILSQCNFYFCCENVALFLLDRVWYIDVAYCYRLELHGLSVVLSVCRSSEPCKNSRTDRDAICVENLGGLKEPCIR